MSARVLAMSTADSGEKLAAGTQIRPQKRTPAGWGLHGPSHLENSTFTLRLIRNSPPTEHRHFLD